MVPAPRPDLPPLPGELARLQQMYSQLPHRSARYRTRQGQEFLDALVVATMNHKYRSIADALGVTVQSVDYMTRVRHPRRPVTWPSDDDLRALHAAWRVVQAAASVGQTIRRQSPEFVPVHQALADLLTRFELPEIALAAGIEPRKLRRFLHEPMDSPAAVARAVRGHLPAQTGTRPERSDRTRQEG